MRPFVSLLHFRLFPNDPISTQFSLLTFRHWEASTFQAISHFSFHFLRWVSWVSPLLHERLSRLIRLISVWVNPFCLSQYAAYFSCQMSSLFCQLGHQNHLSFLDFLSWFWLVTVSVHSKTFFSCGWPGIEFLPQKGSLSRKCFY